MKISTLAPANIAFIKYWGRRDHELFLPANNSISMNINGCKTHTTLELVESDQDHVLVKFHKQEYKQLLPDSIKARNIFDQIKRIRQLAGSNLKIKMKSENNFPADAGLASSASSFAAITAALLLAYGLKEKFDDKQELSRQIRLCGSASAIRSAMDGYVEMLTGFDHESSHAVQIAGENHWNLVDIIAIVETGKKKVSSSQGHELAETSPYFQARLTEMQSRLDTVRQAILDKDFTKLGPAIEEESTSMHAIMMTMKPPAYYWGAGSMRVMRALMDWRDEDDLQAYFTFDAGANPHVICEEKDAEEVKHRLESLPEVQWTILNRPCKGVQETQDHLF